MGRPRKYPLDTDTTTVVESEKETQSLVIDIPPRLRVDLLVLSRQLKNLQNFVDRLIQRERAKSV